MENSAMTRPRICPLDSSCRSEFDVAMNAVLAAPMGSMATISRTNDGANAAASSVAPSASIETASSARVARARIAMYRPPVTAPAPMTEYSAPYAPAPPPKESRTSNGNTTEKL